MYIMAAIELRKLQPHAEGFWIGKRVSRLGSSRALRNLL